MEWSEFWCFSASALSLSLSLSSLFSFSFSFFFYISLSFSLPLSDIFLLLTLLFPLSLNPHSLATINQKKKKKTGLKNKTPRPAMWAAALVGGTAGFLLSYQASAARLMGFAPNDKEVETGLRKR